METPEAGFISALIDAANAKGCPGARFTTVGEAQNLAFALQQQRASDTIISAMLLDLDSGYVCMQPCGSARLAAWLKQAGFRLFECEDQLVVVWGPFPRMLGWKPRSHPGQQKQV